MSNSEENSSTFFKGQTKMSNASIASDDVEMARGYIRAIGGDGYATTMITEAANYLRKRFPHHGEPEKQWTERRLLAWWKRQSDIVRFWQMRELHDGAKAKKSEQELLSAARREYAEFIAKTARLAAFIEHQDSAFHGPQIDALRGQMGRVDLPGNGGTGRD